MEGDAAKIRAMRVRKQRTDRLEAQHILKLMWKEDLPKIWTASGESRDLRQWLWPRHRMVQTRTRIMNQWQGVAIHEGVRYKNRLWRESGRQQLESLSRAPWASRRREDRRQVLDRIPPTMAGLTQAIEEEAEKCCEARGLMTHPGVGALTAVGVCAEPRGSPTVRLRQADRSLSGSGSRRRIQRGTTAVGPYPPTGEQPAAVLAGGSGAGDRAQRWPVAQPIFPLGAAPRPQNRERSDGAETGGSLGLDGAPGMGLRTNAEFRCARGTAWKSSWCAVKHRRND